MNGTADSTSGVTIGFGGPTETIIALAILALQVASLWVIFRKAGEPGWAAVIPIYNLFVLVRVAGFSWWWFLLLWIPILNLIAVFAIPFGLSRRFGHGAAFGLGLLFLPLIFYPVLAFGGSHHTG